MPSILLFLETVNRSDLAIQKEKPVLSCKGTCFLGLLKSKLESYSNMEWNMLDVLRCLRNDFLTGSNCEFAFLSGYLDIYSM